MGCPYTWVKSWMGGLGKKNSQEPAHLHVRVFKDEAETVRVSLPARSARWLIELIPRDVLERIRQEKIPIDDILEDLKQSPVLRCQQVFSLKEPRRQVDVWLE